jgi:hypothetical protein
LAEPDDGERDQMPRLREPHELFEWPAELRHQLKYYGYQLPAVYDKLSEFYREEINNY